MKKFGSIVLSILFAVALLGTSLLGVARKHVKPSIITDLASELFKPVAYEKHNNGLFYPDEWNVIETVDYEIPEGLDFSNLDLNNLDFAEIVNTIGQEYGVDLDEEFVADILSDPETANLIDSYTTEIIDYMTGTTTELNIDPAKLEKVVNTTLDKYEAKTGETIDRTGLSEAITEGVNSAIPELTASLDEVKEENTANFESLKKVMDLMSLKTFIICIIVCVLLAALIFVINRNIFITFRYISIPAIVVGFILFGTGIAMGASLPFVSTALKSEAGLPDNLINAVCKLLKTVFFDVKVTGLVTDLIGVVLCVLGFTLYKTEKKEITENK